MKNRRHTPEQIFRKLREAWTGRARSQRPSSTSSFWLMRPRLVDVTGEAFECAKRYMIRLEPEDLDDPARLSELAAAAKMTPAAFRARFGYLVSGTSGERA